MLIPITENIYFKITQYVRNYENIQKTQKAVSTEEQWGVLEQIRNVDDMKMLLIFSEWLTQ